MKRALITGASGFLGTNLAIELSRIGFRVDGIDLNPPQISHFVSFMQEDILTCQLHGAYDLIFHFASDASPPLYKEHPRRTILTNTLGLYKLIDAYPNQRIIFASTSEIYGDPSVSPQSENYLGNVNSFGERSCYDEAKRCAEAIMYTEKAGGLIRIFNTYGPYMNINDGRVMNTFLKCVLSNERYPIKGTGAQTRSFCYVDDLIRGIIRYALSGCEIPVNLGNDEEISINTLANIFNELFNRDLTPVYIPVEDMDDPRERVPDLTRAREFFGYRNEVGLIDGLKRFYDFFLKKGHLRLPG